MEKIPVGIQLWTVRDEIATDLRGTLARLADIGYTGVELWFESWPAADELTRAMDGLGLQIVGAHVPFLDLRDDFATVAEYHRAIGNNHLVIPGIPTDLRGSPELWVERIDDIRAIAQRAKEAGFRFSYHNHAEEYRDKIGGVEICEYMLSRTDPKLLSIELDTHFVATVGKDPADYIRRYGDRMALLHIKEKHADPRYADAEVGHGTIDWGSVFDAACAVDVEWYLVEQNCEEHPTMQSVKMSYDFLRSKGIAHAKETEQ